MYYILSPRLSCRLITYRVNWFSTNSLLYNAANQQSTSENSVQHSSHSSLQSLFQSSNNLRSPSSGNTHRFRNPNAPSHSRTDRPFPKLSSQNSWSPNANRSRPSTASSLYSSTNTRTQILQAAKQLTMKVLDLRRTIKVTKGGKSQSFSVLLVLGDQNGHAGLGQAKSKEIGEAIEKASIDAYKNIVPIPITPTKTIHHVLQTKYKASLIFLRPAKDNHGVRTHEVIMNICEAVGIENLSGKVRGSTNSLNVAKGAFDVLKSQTVPLQATQMKRRQPFDQSHSSSPKNSSNSPDERRSSYYDSFMRI